MTTSIFSSFFQGKALEHLCAVLDLALAEDGPDLTSEALFGGRDMLGAEITAKQEAVLAGSPLAAMVCARLDPEGKWDVDRRFEDGDRVRPGDVLLTLRGRAAMLLKAERVILNFLTHLSGIATLTATYVQALKGSRARLLDTRKTLPGLRHAEKYAVRMGGGLNHRLDLAEMLMLKDNHIDRAGSITRAVAALRKRHAPCPPIEVECRTLNEVKEAAACNVARIMLDNMDPPTMAQALDLIPKHVESEVSGGISLANIAAVAELGPDYISVGRITHSAPAVDFSMRITELENA